MGLGRSDSSDASGADTIKPLARQADCVWRTIWLAAAVLLSVLLIALLRFAALGERPIHADEAVQAFIFADLLEHGRYVYDPQHYHGPLPHYLNLGLMALLGVESLPQMEVWHLRLLASISGVAVIVLCVFCARWGSLSLSTLAERGIGSRKGELKQSASNRRCVACRFSVGWRAAVLAGLSPFVVHYSRMGIHECLLAALALAVPLLFASLMRQPTHGMRPLIYAVMLGLCAGALHTVKETWSIIAFSWFVAVCVLAPRELCRLLSVRGGYWRCWAVAAVVALVVSAVLYSGIGQRWGGVADSWLTQFAYQTGEGHNRPWFYYLQEIFSFRIDGGFFGEGVLSFFVLSALCWVRWQWKQKRILPQRQDGGASTIDTCLREADSSAQGIIGQGAEHFCIPFLPRFLALSALVQVVVYSLIAYKTPWLMLVPVVCVIPLAAWGWEGLAQLCRYHGGWFGRAGATLLWAFVLIAAGWQAWVGSFIRAADPRVPFVYAPTLVDADAQLRQLATTFSADALANDELTTALSAGAVSDFQPESEGLIAVVGRHYWPLPWYFRAVRERVGYFDSVPADTDQFTLIIREGGEGAGQLLELRSGYFLRMGSPVEVLLKNAPAVDADYFRLGY